MRYELTSSPRSPTRSLSFRSGGYFGRLICDEAPSEAKSKSRPLSSDVATSGSPSQELTMSCWIGLCVWIFVTDGGESRLAQVL